MSSIQTQQLAMAANTPSPSATASTVSNQLQQKDYSDDKSSSGLATSSSAQTVSSYCTSTTSSYSAPAASATTSLSKQNSLTNRGRVKKLSFIYTKNKKQIHYIFILI